MARDFVHDSLHLSNDSIRLLQILPASQAEEIHCQINQFPISECPIYCAVSYSWGEPDQPRMIRLNGCRFRVRKNLWWLLYHFRQVNETRRLWIDAICINQGSIKERNHQVGLMGKVYERAETVLVWLGRASKDSKLALDLLMDFPSITQPTAIIRRPIREDFSAGRSIFSHLEGETYQKLSYPENHAANYNIQGEINDESWAALANLCRREYWYRTWIIQELLLASKIDLLLGVTKFSWKALEHIANAIKSIDVIESSKAEKIADILDSLPFRFVEQRVKQQLASLGTLLYNYQDSQCVDPRDKVYAMLGFASDCRAGGTLVADYSKDLCQVYMDVIQFYGDKSSKEGIRFSFLVLKILGITPAIAGAFLNRQYNSGWLPLKSIRCSEYLNRVLADEADSISLMEVCGTFVGWISDIDTTFRHTNSGESFLTRLQSEFGKLFSKAVVKRPMNFSYDPFSVPYASEVVCDIDTGSDLKANGANTGRPTKITITSPGNRRRTGIACSEARAVHQVYQFDKSGPALVFSETEWGIEVVGEAIMDEDPDFSTKLDRSDVQRFMVDALDLLAITRRGRMIDVGTGTDGWPSK